MRTLQGTITSNRMQKTVVVRIDRLRQHPKYRKYERISQKFKAAVDDAGAYRIGDIVRITETRPLSKDKRWRVVDVVKRAPTIELADDALPAESDPNQTI